VEAGEGHHVGGKLTEVGIQLARKSQAGGDACKGVNVTITIFGDFRNISAVNLAIFVTILQHKLPQLE
jgi:hypothetical protein